MSRHVTSRLLLFYFFFSRSQKAQYNRIQYELRKASIGRDAEAEKARGRDREIPGDGDRDRDRTSANQNDAHIWVRGGGVLS